MNLILTGSNFLFPLLTFPYVSRILEPEGTGKVAFATSFVTYFIMLSSFGVANYGVRAVAQVRDNKYQLSKVTQEILFINLVMMFFTYLVFFTLLFFSDKLGQEKALLNITSLLILFTIIGIEWFYKGIEQYQYITVRTILFRLIALVATFIFINSKSDYITFALISMIAAVGSSILNIINVRKYISFKWYSSYELKKHLKPMFLLFLTSFAISVYTNTDATMLGFLRTDTDVGYYNAAVRIKAILLSIVTSLGVVLLPRLSYYIQHNMTIEFNLALKKSVNFIMLISLPVAVFFAVFSKETILVLAGNAYLESIIPLKIIMFTVVLVGITNILGIQILLPLKKDGILLISVVGGAIANIGLNLYFIPKLGATGAAISTTIAELVVLILQFIFVKEYWNILFRDIQYCKIFGAILVSAITTKLILDVANFSIFFMLVLAAIIFFSVYLILLVLLKEKFLSENILVIVKHKLSF
ncbi:oligosaccharide flippase family protein [Actinobacillus equuli]|uniref:Flippase Wzx n=1 Tax=Actinobacillus equuli TaxID=718 RepID=A0AAX3FK36_ACTEU|nr:flippase [Actinobacillus equuli]WGE44336.1 oligosaccharide flippase family protein [Actinobacillus equuli subsp. equuli]VEE91532.1 flippase Wzx [Actinobacillus equuli]